ncbi:nicotinamide riboside transporter PnuC [Flavonifractor sp. HCP28S3_F3]|uniref:nicotinamide riboside transporter PnuC n=1 Tax=Flavonifractor sp. HCP28S3_F3 TaxID=3438939 RepID=UPI003F8AA82D
MDKKTSYFTKFEKGLWLVSVTAIVGSYLLFQAGDVLTLLASLIGATFLILNAKGNVWGQVLTVVFSLLYGVISYSTAYYGEMITYLGMTAPIAVASVVSWARNPAQEGEREVKVNRLPRWEYLLLVALSLAVTCVFYFILKACHTQVLWLSTLSVFTSFLASYLTMRRSPFFAVGYAANDVVLIALWLIAARQDRQYSAVVICFAVFLINDLYGYWNWIRLKKKQAGELEGCPA